MISQRLAIVGAGNMGASLVEGILNKGLLPASHIILTNRSRGKMEPLQEKWGVGFTYDNAQAVRFASTVILAVKPQDVPEALQQIRGALGRRHLIVSVVAGVNIAAIKSWLGHPAQPVVRVMPNTAARVGEAMSGWAASPEVSPGQKRMVRRILGTLGKEICFNDEGLLDLVTAVSGSGPAYVFYLAEQLIKSAREIGLPEDHCQELVLQTIWGAAKMLRENGGSAEKLRAAVTSKGGTTEAALREFADGDLPGLIAKGVAAACQRSKELGAQWAPG